VCGLELNMSGIDGVFGIDLFILRNEACNYSGLSWTIVQGNILQKELRISRLHKMQTIVTYDCGVCLSVCLSRVSTRLHLWGLFGAAFTKSLWPLVIIIVVKYIHITCCWVWLFFLLHTLAVLCNSQHKCLYLSHVGGDSERQHGEVQGDVWGYGTETSPGADRVARVLWRLIFSLHSILFIFCCVLISRIWPLAGPPQCLGQL